MSSYGGMAVPGISAALYTSEREILWGGADTRLPLLYRNSILDGTIRDAGNSPTTICRRGLLLGTITSTGQQIQWDATATDGTQTVTSILNVETRAQDFNANNVDRAFSTLLKAPLIAGQLLIKGAALVGHTDEYLARRQLQSMGCVLDDDPQGYYAAQGYRYQNGTAQTLTVTAAQNGTTFFMSNVGTVAVTLPALQAGLEYTFVRTADEEMAVASAAGDDMVVGNDLSADSVTWTTASQQIGAMLKVSSHYINTTTLKWIAQVVPAPYSTGAFLASALAT